MFHLKKNHQSRLLLEKAPGPLYKFFLSKSLKLWLVVKAFIAVGSAPGMNLSSFTWVIDFEQGRVIE